jgi:flagellar assembly factor FliW
MPQVLTRDFGLLDYDVSSELDFPVGLPGFESEKRFILIENDALAPMVFLQSLATPAICFLTVPVQVVDPGYQIGMREEDHEQLGLDNTAAAGPGGVLALAILTAKDTCTANLLAPVVVNMQRRMGVQAVRADARYSHQHPIPEASICS